MIARKAASIKMPTLNSYFVSRFSDETLEYLRKQKSFASYNRITQEYEVTPSVFNRMKERPGIFRDEVFSYTRFERKNDGKFGYQQDAVYFAGCTDNVLLNFPQGMGKTFTALSIINVYNIEKTLVVCGQSNLQEEWLKEVKKWGLGHLNVRIVGGDSDCGNKKKILWLKERDGQGVDLINIEALRNIDVINALNNRGYNCIIVDEVQSVKGWGAEQTKGLHELKRWLGQTHIALSGTPVLNDPLEYFSVLKFLGVLKDTVKSTFDSYYGNWGFDFFGHYVCNGYKNLDDLAELLEPVLCYVDKSELGLPPKTRRRVDLTWQGYSKNEYDELRKLYTGKIKNIKAAGYNTKPQIRSIMQFLSSTAQCKIDWVLKRAKREKVLVFSKSTQVLEVYQEAAEVAGLSVLYYHGGLSMEERLNVLRRWSSGEGVILLLSIMAARYGLNLTEAAKTLFLEPPPSLSILEQAEDRAWRIGQEKDCLSELLCCSDLDESGLENIEIKQGNLDTFYEKTNANYEL